MTDPLSRLAVLHGTDKFGTHDYTPTYHRLLEARRDQPLRMLEIGVGGYGDEDRGGESLAMWRDWLPQATITGIDIQKKRLDLGPRVAIRQGSQVDPDFLAQIVAERGPFDVILDDGSHRNDHVIATFGLLFEGLTPGGLYLAEDVQTAFHPRHGGSPDLTPPNSVGFFAGLMARIGAGQGGAMAGIERFHNIVAVHKARPGAMGTAQAHLNARGITATDLSPQRLTIRAIARALDACPEGGAVRITGWPRDPALIRRLFAEIDHREIAVHFPDHAVTDLAPRILSLACFADGIVIHPGDNTWPSNFAFDIGHPRVAAAMEWIGGVLASDAATERGLLTHADMLARYRGRAAAAPLLERLAARACRERRFYQLMGQHLTQGGRIGEAIVLYREALGRFADDTNFAAVLANLLARQGDLAGAETVLRDSLAVQPRGRAAMMGLANLMRQAGRHDEGIMLAEQAINLFPRPMRAERLTQLAAWCEAAGQPERADRARARLERLEETAPPPA